MVCTSSTLAAVASWLESTFWVFFIFALVFLAGMLCGVLLHQWIEERARAHGTAERLAEDSPDDDLDLDLS